MLKRTESHRANLKNNDGFIAIVSLLIVAVVTMLFAMSMLMDGVDNASLSSNSINYESAHINATTCLEDVLLRMKEEDQFIRNLNYTISEGNSCSTTIAWNPESQFAPGVTERLVDLDVVGTSNSFSRTFRYSIDVKKFDVNDTDGSVTHMKSISFVSISEISS